MAREEEIIQASIEYTIKIRPMCIGCDTFSEITYEMNRNHDFEEGNKCADKTMISEIYKWLRNNTYKCFHNEFSSYEEYVKYLKEKGFAVDVPILNIY